MTFPSCEPSFYVLMTDIGLACTFAYVGSVACRLMFYAIFGAKEAACPQ